MSAQIGMTQISMQRPTCMYTRTNTGASMIMECTMPSTHKYTCSKTHKYSQRHIHSLLCKSTRAYLHMQTHSLLYPCKYMHLPSSTPDLLLLGLGFPFQNLSSEWELLLANTARKRSSHWFFDLREITQLLLDPTALPDLRKKALEEPWANCWAPLWETMPVSHPSAEIGTKTAGRPGFKSCLCCFLATWMWGLPHKYAELQCPLL